MTALGDVPGFAIDLEVDVDGTCVRVVGELDIATAPELQKTLLDPELCPGPLVVVDLRPLTFIDSTGIGALVAARAHAVTTGGSISVRCLDGPVARVLALTRLDEVMEVVVDPA